jgi:alpha-glucosidase
VLGAPPREPWRFAEPARGTIVAWLRFRYRILPYLYTLAHEAAACGAPLVRPLWWPGPAGDTAGENVDDAFLLGDTLLVAPVTTPGASGRSVVLPPGQWGSVWAGDDSGGRGPDEARLDAPAGRIPVLARAGSIIALDDGWTGAGGPCPLDADGDVRSDGTVRGHADDPHAVLGLDHAPRRLAFHCWPDGEGEALGTCVDDAGDGHGPVRRDALALTVAETGASAVTWERHGDFPAPALVRVVLHGLVADTATADGVAVTVHGSSVECGPFSELRFYGVRPAPGRRR